jgi:hypothetical protein
MEVVYVLGNFRTFIVLFSFGFHRFLPNLVSTGYLLRNYDSNGALALSSANNSVVVLATTSYASLAVGSTFTFGRLISHHLLSLLPIWICPQTTPTTTILHTLPPCRLDLDPIVLGSKLITNTSYFTSN